MLCAMERVLEVMSILVHLMIELLLRWRLLHLLVAPRIALLILVGVGGRPVLADLSPLLDSLTFAHFSLAQLPLVGLVLMLQLSLVVPLQLLLMWRQAMVILNASLHPRRQIIILRLI